MADTPEGHQHLFIGGDHAGYGMKEVLKKHLEEKGLKFVDLGAFSEESMDYPDIAQEVGEKVRENDDSKGILICGTGIGVAIAANKMKGIRAANCTSVEMAEKSREHNDANIVTIGSRITDESTAKQIVDKFLETSFSTEERHKRRVEKIDHIRSGGVTH